MRTNLLAGLTMVALGLAACTDEASPPDGGIDAAKDLALVDAPSDMSPKVDTGSIDAADARPDLYRIIYWAPGCGPNAVPRSNGGGEAGKCLGTFCSCNGETVLGNCQFSYEPYAYYGECTGDGGAHPGQIEAYTKPGCGAAAAPVWTTPGLGSGGAILCSYCLCDGVTEVVGYCHYSDQPYSAKGACPADGGS